MEMLEALLEENAAARVVEIERRETGPAIKGDFEGSVTGTWVKLNELGLGVVSYNQKEYITRPLGFMSIAAGQKIFLSYAAGVYYSSW
jgi:hypothetical protein